ILASAIGKQRAKHIVKQMFKARRNNCRDAFRGRWHGSRQSHFGSAQTIEQLCCWCGGFVQQRVQPDGVCMLPSTGAHNQLELFSVCNVGHKSTWWFTCADVWLDRDLSAIGQYDKIRV